MRVDVSSFGFKRGSATGLLTSCSMCASYRIRTGSPSCVRSQVLTHPYATSCSHHPEAGEFLSKVNDMLDFLLPHYEAEGKSYLSIAVGCTGGRHRSVALSEAIGAHLNDSGVETSIHHRDLVH